VRLAIDGVLAASGSTDASGAAELTLRVPAGTLAGKHAVTGADDKSRFPVTAKLLIGG
jgi:hypothetical protein